MRQALSGGFLASLTNLWIFAGGYSPIVSERLALGILAIRAGFGRGTACFYPIMLDFTSDKLALQANLKLLAFVCVPGMLLRRFHSSANGTFLILRANRSCPLVSERLAVHSAAKRTRAWKVAGCFFPGMRADLVVKNTAIYTLCKALTR
jgi:hypothetical protein